MLRARTLLRPVAAARQQAVARAGAVRFATTTADLEVPRPKDGIDHHDVTAHSPPPPPGVPVDPQLNGYPQLPEVSLQTRTPWGWWDIQERKNFNELVMEEEDRLGMWGPDVHKTSPGSALLQLSLALSLVGCFAYMLSVTRPEATFVRREYPYNGLEKELGGHQHARVESPDLDDE